jgi:hypothetical protein
MSPAFSNDEFRGFVPSALRREGDQKLLGCESIVTDAIIVRNDRSIGSDTMIH